MSYRADDEAAAIVRLPWITDLHPTTRRLLLARTLRSVGQGALVVDMALYLRALHWSAAAIGIVLSGAGLFGAALSLAVGTSSDRLRRKPFLLVYESIVLLCSLAMMATARRSVIVAATVLAGFGRGANGAAGPFSPAEQAWLAEEVLPERRGVVYSFNTACGFFGMGLGAVMAVLPAMWHHWFPGAVAYRPLFALVATATLINLFVISGGTENHRGTPRLTDPGERQREAGIRRRENWILLQLVCINGFNGVAIGLTGPLISYWFALRFHVGPAEIAPMMAVTFFVTGVASLLAGKLTQHIGVVQSVVWARLAGLVLLVLLPIMPWYWLASLVFLLRSAFNRSSAGARQALTIGLVRGERRGLATSLNAVSMQVPQSIGPTIAGYLLDAGQLTLPFYIAAALQGVYLVAYRRVFLKYDPPRAAGDAAVAAP